jgi:hypothetical protein
MPQKEGIIPSQLIASKIYIIRRLKVMLDRDLAQLYGVETRVLNQAVKRNAERFPDDFMIKLTRDEVNRISQFVTSSDIKFSKSVHAFTQEGVAMLSSVLNSKRAIQVNIQIMRVFTRLRELLLSDKDIRRELEELKRVTDDRFRVVFETLDQLLSAAERPKRKIGFEVREKTAQYLVNKKKTNNNSVNSLRGKYKGRRLVKSLMAEKKREREL